MVAFDPSQRAALALDAARHGRVLGAPGTGKTTALIETFLRLAGSPGWSPNQLLVLAPNRIVAKSLLGRIEAGLSGSLTGSPVRTAASLGFAIVSRDRAERGLSAPRLLTGTAHDEAIEAVLSLAPDDAISAAGLTRELTQAPAFRTELREIWRAIDDAGIDPVSLAAAMAADAAIEAAQLAMWTFATQAIEQVRRVLLETRPHEFPASGLMRTAVELLDRDAIQALPHGTVPRLILVDDAQELTEGGLALLAACANRGSRIRVFGDPDIATSAFHGGGTAVLSRLSAELRRRGHEQPEHAGVAEEVVVLEGVHRHGPELREMIAGLTGRIGAAGAGSQRRAAASGNVSAHIGSFPDGTIPDETSPDDTSPDDTQRGGTHEGGASPVGSAVQFARVGSRAEQLGALAHRLRERRLGLGPVDSRGETREPVPWSEMAVICRSRGEASRAARLLAAQQVPTGIAAGGIVLREHAIVRELIRLLRHALGLSTLAPTEILELAGGVVGGLDPIALRRLRSALVLQEKRITRERALAVQSTDALPTGADDFDGQPSGDRTIDNRPGIGPDPVSGDENFAQARAAEEFVPRPLDALVAEAFASPGADAVVDSRGGRALRRIALMARAGVQVHEAGGSPREALWALWEAAKLAPSWERDARAGAGVRAATAHRSLDAVVGLFYALQRHEEQGSEQSIGDVLEALDSSALPEDSLAARSVRDTVTVTTPQGAIGREFAVVVVLGPQEGVWPNLRARGSMLGSASLERWLHSGVATVPGRRDTMHDELRLFAQSCSRARNELLVLAVADDEQHPGPFFGFGRRYLVEGLPSSRLTLRGAVAEMRRRVTVSSGADEVVDTSALAALVALAREGVTGAHPDDWYGVNGPSTDAPLTDLSGDPDAHVRVSPSQLERAEECPLNWVIAKLGGGDTSAAAGIGTLLHHALETIREPDPDRILQAVTAEWGRLPFEAEWESERLLGIARAMSEAVAGYIDEFDGSSRELTGTEASFELPIGRALLTGIVDRVESVVSASGARQITVLDLKTGGKRPSAHEVIEHAQLQAYQLATLMGAFSAGEAAVTAELGKEAVSAPSNGGARLLYVHPDALLKGQNFREFAQEPLDNDRRLAFELRVQAVAEIMAAGRFTARVEHHCTDEHKFGDCRIHIVPAVSAA